MEVKHISTGYKPQFWQNQVHGCLKRFNVLVLHRRAGKSVFSINEMIDQGLRNNLKNPKYAYMAPTYKQASIIAWDYLLEYTKLIPGFDSNKKDLEVTIKRPAPWDDKISYRLLGSDNPDSLRGIYLDGAVLDEFAQCDPIVWGEIIRPALADRKGWAIFIGCVAKDTLILGEQGLEEIGPCPVGYSEENKMIYGLGGFHKAENRYGNPKLPTLKIRSKAGLELEATPNHRIWTPDGWVRMDELRVGAQTYMQYDQQVYGTEECDLDFAYLLGLYLAEGSYERKIYRLTISNPDVEIIEFLKNNYGMTCVDGMHSRLNSKEFMEKFLEWVPDAGEVRAKEKTISQRILRLNKECMQMFLRGYIDGDGTYHKKKQAIICSTSSEKLSKQLQCLFLNVGYRASRSSRIMEPTEVVHVYSKIYTINIDGDSAYKFSREIGTKLERYKNNCQSWRVHKGHLYWFKRNDFGEINTKYSYLTKKHAISRATLDIIDTNQNYDRQLLADTIVEITPSCSETFDFCIPDTHSYFSNGFASHNTPKGKNHFYNRYEKAKANPNWYTKILRADESGIIPKAELEEMRADMTEDEFEQEMLCNFSSAAPGVYFGKLMAQLRRDGRIRSVPYDPQYPVDTFWDLGIGDSTAIWFRQRVGINWHYIDYYEKSGEGLEHYVKVLKDLPYAYGRHIVPHDAAARDLSTGVTRQEFLRKLGLRVEIQKRQAVDDRIQAIRTLLPKCYIDEIKCGRGVSALEDYQKEWDSKLMMYKNKPFHNWTSHGVDSFGYSALDTRDSDFEGTEFGKNLPERASGEYNEFGGV